MKENNIYGMQKMWCKMDSRKHWKSIPKCPFCGATLADNIAENKESPITKDMRFIMDKFGEKILLQPNLFLAAFDDIAPQKKRARMLLSVALNTGVANFFINCPKDEHQKVINMTVNALDGILSEPAVETIITVFIEAFGWESKLIKKAPRQDSITESKLTPEEMLKKGRIYDKQKDYVESMKWYQKAAEAGNSDAMCAIGFMYDDGRGVRKNYSEAMKWYKKAVDAGNSEGMLNIGFMYSEGTGVRQDYTEAMKWYKKAADAGNSNAMENIGNLYEDGNGVRQDYAEAMKWYQKAANAGNSWAMRLIGNLYEEGKGVRQNYTEAMRWYQKAETAEANFSDE